MRQAIIALTLLLTAIPAVAQRGTNFAWWNSTVADDMNLSVPQRQEIRRIVRSYRSRLIDARAAAQKAEGDLQDIFNADKIDMNLATPVINRLAQARAESTRVLTEMSVQLRGVLTLDQWRELVRRWGAMKKGRGLSDTEVAP